MSLASCRSKRKKRTSRYRFAPNFGGVHLLPEPPQQEQRAAMPTAQTNKDNNDNDQPRPATTNDHGHNRDHDDEREPLRKATMPTTQRSNDNNTPHNDDERRTTTNLSAKN